MPAPATPARDRIAATLIVLLLHALAIMSLAARHAGGGTGQGANSGSGDGPEDWIAVTFLDKKAGAKPDSLAVETPPARVVAEAPRTTAPVPARTDDKPANDAASPEDAREGGGASTPQDDLGARYLAALRAAVLDQWQAQGGGAIPRDCKVVIDQAAGGKALRAWVMQCADLPLGERIRLETAAMAQPLPYAGFEPVFQGHVEVVF